MLEPKDIQNKFVKDWLAYCGNSESPTIFNMWAGLSTLAACLDRDNTLRIGRFTYFANMYIFLVGPAAVRKSSSAALGKKLLEKYTTCKFGPTDTAGKKQGLLTSFYSQYQTKSEDEKLTDEFESMMKDEHVEKSPVADNVASAFGASRKAKAGKTKKSHYNKNDEDPVTSRSLFIFADELATLIGLNQIEMINFLTEIYYCPADYSYALAREKRDIDFPYLNLIGCITPTSLAAHLPPQSVGQGFSSRVIMVYEGVARAKVFPAPELDKDLEIKIGAKLVSAHDFAGNFIIQPQALKMMGEIYHNFKPNINDSRFQHYEQRRLDHLIKLCMVLAAGEDRHEVCLRDVADAQIILEATEVNMAESLGEIGLDKLTIAKQQMREMIMSSWPLGISVSVLKQNMLRDMQPRDFETTLSTFANNGLCKLTQRDHQGSKIDIIIPVLNEEVRGRNNLAPKTETSNKLAGFRTGPKPRGKSESLLARFMQN